MIAKIIPSSNQSKSGFSVCARYVLAARGSSDPDTWERTTDYVLRTDTEGQHSVGQVRVTNCSSDDPAIATKEILLTQSFNTRAKTKHIHLVISFPPGEDPGPQNLEFIEKRLVDCIGLSSHQRISAVHTDTAHKHMHVVINRIDPETHLAPRLSHSHIKLRQACLQLEAQLGLRPTSAISRGQGATPNHSAAKDAEIKSGNESFESWLKRELAPRIIKLSSKPNSSWKSIHSMIEEHGVVLKGRGAGLVFINPELGVAAKPSAIDRRLSKASLEQNLGPFNPSRSNLSYMTRVERVDDKNTYAREPLKKSSTLWRQYRQYSADTRKARQPVFEARKAALNEIRERSKTEIRRTSVLSSRVRWARIRTIKRDTLIELHRERQKHQVPDTMTWSNWLRAEADRGNETALAELQSHDEQSTAASAAVREVEKPEGKLKAIRSLVTQGKTTRFGHVPYFTIDDGMLSETKTGIRIIRESEQATVAMVAMVGDKWPDRKIRIGGDLAFQARAATLAGKFGLDVVFENERLDTMRRSAMQRERARQQEDSRGR